jgi:hypothetical protein
MAVVAISFHDAAAVITTIGVAIALNRLRSRRGVAIKLVIGCRRCCMARRLILLLRRPLVPVIVMTGERGRRSDGGGESQAGNDQARSQKRLHGVSPFPADTQRGSSLNVSRMMDSAT